MHCTIRDFRSALRFQRRQTSHALICRSLPSSAPALTRCPAPKAAQKAQFVCENLLCKMPLQLVSTPLQRPDIITTTNDIENSVAAERANLVRAKRRALSRAIRIRRADLLIRFSPPFSFPSSLSFFLFFFSFFLHFPNHFTFAFRFGEKASVFAVRYRSPRSTRPGHFVFAARRLRYPVSRLNEGWPLRKHSSFFFPCKVYMWWCKVRRE